jgi:cytochrome c551/c552
MKDIASKYADTERAAALLDDVEQSIAGVLRKARHTQLWDEKEVPMDAWHSDIQSALKLLVKNL